ncbi:MAG: HD domain-containing protein [Planctomycetaceae bacterium]|jgi:3'-5' exoribonuclease|nr:HD domain-containing protein [Planctomycetaceae bacterium]
MMPNMSIVALHEMEPNQEADFFALFSEKELLKTKQGKPYFLVIFRDAFREVRFPVWSDAVVYKEIKNLKPGTFCKLRAKYVVPPTNSNYGAQLEIRRIRPVTDDDVKDGFDPIALRPKSPLPLEAMFEELQRIAADQLGKGNLLNLVTKILKDHRAGILTCVAARQHHHCYIGGLLEHTLSVTKIAVALVDHYHKTYPERKKDISRSLVVAGAILHDVGKVREYEPELGALRHSTEGELIGHALLSRDLIREAANEIKLEPAIQTRLEHIVVAHQRFPDWGAAKPPMSLEAMIVHHADSCDALLGCFWNTFSQDMTDYELTSKKNVLGYPLLKPSKNS